MKSSKKNLLNFIHVDLVSTISYKYLIFNFKKNIKYKSVFVFRMRMNDSKVYADAIARDYVQGVNSAGKFLNFKSLKQ